MWPGEPEMTEALRPYTALLAAAGPALVQLFAGKLSEAQGC